MAVYWEGHLKQKTCFLVGNTDSRWSIGLQWPMQFGFYRMYYDGDLYAIHLGPLWICW